MRRLDRFVSKLSYDATFSLVRRYLFDKGYSIEQSTVPKESGFGGFFQEKLERDGETYFFKSDFVEEIFGFLMAVALVEGMEL